MIENTTISVSFTGDELYETIKLYDILRDMDFVVGRMLVLCLSLVVNPIVCVSVVYELL